MAGVESTLAHLLSQVDETLKAQQAEATAHTLETNELLVKRCAESEAKRVTLEAALAAATKRADDAEDASRRTMRDLIAARARADAAEQRAAHLEALLAKASDAIGQVERGAIRTVDEASAHAILEVSHVPDLGTERIRTLLSHFGDVARLELRHDPALPSGYRVALVEYTDVPTAMIAAERLHGMQLGESSLRVVRRPTLAAAAVGRGSAA
mmetsp:Transcript_5757/g.14734  ORF Transcript_5757/g.14734 Transcript_5757/m.14734 type:complete len:212 (-) Transcript_5757:66-701(-)